MLHWNQDTHYHTTQENGACANGMSLLTEKTKLQFSHIHSSMMFNTNGTKFTVNS